MIVFVLRVSVDEYEDECGRVFKLVESPLISLRLVEYEVVELGAGTWKVVAERAVSWSKSLYDYVKTPQSPRYEEVPNPELFGHSPLFKEWYNHPVKVGLQKILPEIPVMEWYSIFLEVGVEGMLKQGYPLHPVELARYDGVEDRILTKSHLIRTVLLKLIELESPSLGEEDVEEVINLELGIKECVEDGTLVEGEDGGLGMNLTFPHLHYFIKPEPPEPPQVEETMNVILKLNQLGIRYRTLNLSADGKYHTDPPSSTTVLWRGKIESLVKENVGGREKWRMFHSKTFVNFQTERIVEARARIVPEPEIFDAVGYEAIVVPDELRFRRLGRWLSWKNGCPLIVRIKKVSISQQ